MAPFRIIVFILLAFHVRAYSFEFQEFKRVSLPSFPHISVPIYKSSGNKGPAILFIHGNSSSSRSFVRQKLGRLGRTHKLFFLDLPGFGRADKVDPNLPFPVDQNGNPLGFAEYQLGLVEAVIRVANDPDVMAEVLVGWSLGGDLALLAQGTGLLPNTKGLVMFGTAPVGANAPAVSPFLGPNVPGMNLGILPSFGYSFQLDPFSPLGFNFLAEFTDPVPGYAPWPISKSDTMGEAYIRAFFNKKRRLYGFIPYFFKQDGFVRSDSRARGSVGVVGFGLLPPGGAPLPDELDVLRGLQGDPNDPMDDIPIAVVHGTEEAFVNIDYLRALKQEGFLPTLWKGKIIKVKRAGHAVQYERPDRFNRLLKRFIKFID